MLVILLLGGGGLLLWALRMLTVESDVHCMHGLSPFGLVREHMSSGVSVRGVSADRRIGSHGVWRVNIDV